MRDREESDQVTNPVDQDSSRAAAGSTYVPVSDLESDAVSKDLDEESKGAEPSGDDSGSVSQDPDTDSSDEESAQADGSSKGGRRRHPLLTLLREAVVVMVSALAISLVLKTFLIQPFYIPSESMEPTLVEDDRIIVNKLAPGPFDLERGDVVVFLDPGGWLAGSSATELTPFQQLLTWVGLLPVNAGEHLVKRLIGLPGDRVVCCDANGAITVNAVPISEPYLVDGASPSDLAFDVVVPADHIWVMGDNRPRSADSRFHTDSTSGGFVPIENVVGRAFVIMLPLDRASVLARPEDTFADVPDP
ncbi:MAG: signal peptidase I [Beutenbergiaceae bacterium]